MNKKIIKQLREIASSLPPVYHAHRSNRTNNEKGAFILQRYPEATDTWHRKLDPDSYYIYETKNPKTNANHLRALKKAYSCGGFAAVNNYVNNLNK